MNDPDDFLPDLKEVLNVLAITGEYHKNFSDNTKLIKPWTPSDEPDNYITIPELNVGLCRKAAKIQNLVNQIEKWRTETLQAIKLFDRLENSKQRASSLFTE